MPDSAQPVALLPDAPLAMRRLRFVCTSQGGNLQHLEGGKAFHGALGAMLHQHFPQTFRELFGEETDRSWPRLYVLRPPLEQRGHYAPGDTLILECSLFGEAIVAADDLIGAVHQVGQSGLGRQRGRFELNLVQEVTLQGARLIWSEETGWLGAQPAMDARGLLAITPPASVSSLELNFLTPLMLKADNRLQSLPEMPLLIRRLLGRYSQLTGVTLATEISQPLLADAQKVVIERHDTRLSRDQRYSARQRQLMPQQGILGRAKYAGPMTALVPWLVLGEWLHLGNKTTFGYGLYRIGHVE